MRNILVRLLIAGSIFVVPSPAFCITRSADTFTEASDTALESHTSDMGNTWDVAGSAALQVDGPTDLCENTGAATRNGRQTTNLGNDEMVISLDCKLNAATTSTTCTLLGRILGTENGADNAYKARFRGDGTNIDMLLDKDVLGATTSLGTFNLNASSTATLVGQLIITDGSKIFRSNGITYITSTDNSLIGNNFGGLAIQTTAPRADNYRAEVFSPADIRNGTVYGATLQ